MQSKKRGAASAAAPLFLKRKYKPEQIFRAFDLPETGNQNSCKIATQILIK